MTTTELIERYYAHFNAANWDAMLELLTDDVSHDVNEGSREGGKTAFKVFLDRMNRCYRERIEPVTVMVNADGSHAAAEYVVSGTYEATDAGLPEARGQTYRLPGGAFFEVRDGRISRVTNYYNLQDWLAQVA
ncbi:MAG: SnoaL-like domain-containing protein [Pleurocapsa sp. SU_196_0]|nr:SnoaL-like domain-containing protein [Pleurocapsa sp. SU_196_0]